MSFDPNEKNPFSDLFADKKKKPDDAIVGMFAAQKKEFEPIDDDEDDLPVVPPAISSAAANKAEINQPQLAQNEVFEEAVSTSQAAVPIKAEKPKSHWEKLASALGLTRDKTKNTLNPEKPRGKDPVAFADPEAQQNLRSKKTAAPKANPLDDLFEPPIESVTEHEKPRRMVDDVTPFGIDSEIEVNEPIGYGDADIGDGDEAEYIEFEVEDLVPKQSALPRGGSNRSRRDSRERRPTNDSPEPRRPRAQAVDEPDSSDSFQEPVADRELSSDPNRKRRRRRRPNRGESTSPDSTDKHFQEEKLSSEVPANESSRRRRPASPRSETPRRNETRSKTESVPSSRRDSSASNPPRRDGFRNDEARGDRKQAPDSRRSNQRDRNLAAVDIDFDPIDSDEMLEPTIDNDTDRFEPSDELVEERKPRRRSRRSRGDRKKLPVDDSTVARTPRDDEDDDFVEDDDVSVPRKSVTTWRDVISVIVEKNISAHGKNPSSNRSRTPRRRR